MRWERQAVFWLGALIGLALFLYVFSSILLPFVVALFIGYLLDPVADKLESVGFNRLTATLIILGGFSILFLLILLLVLPVLVHQLTTFIGTLPDLIVRLQKLDSEQGEQWSARFGSTILQRFGIDPSFSADPQKSLG